MNVNDDTTTSVFDMIGVKYCTEHPDVWIAYPGLWAPNIRDCPHCHLSLIRSTNSTSQTSTIGSSKALVKTISAKKIQINNNVSNALHKLRYAVQTFAGYDLPNPETYQNFPFQIGNIEIHANDCKRCDRWIYFANFLTAERSRQKTTDELEKFCVFLLGRREKLLTIRTNFIDLQARSAKLHRIQQEFILQCEQLKSPSHKDFKDWVAFDASCQQLNNKEQAVATSFEKYKNKEYSVLDIAQQVHKAEISLRARNVAVKSDKMNALLLFFTEFIEDNEKFITNIDNDLKLYENHLNIVQVALKKLIDNQDFEID